VIKKHVELKTNDKILLKFKDGSQKMLNPGNLSSFKIIIGLKKKNYFKTVYCYLKKIQRKTPFFI
jgi:hypothetical protein